VISPLVKPVAAVKHVTTINPISAASFRVVRNVVILAMLIVDIPPSPVPAKIALVLAAGSEVP
jgi:hypothetical protein